MSKSLLCFGDSNTYGTPPMKDRIQPVVRYGADIRWPRIAATELGAGWDVIEEGLPGRTAQYEDPLMGPHMNGQLGLRIALASHGPLDLVAIMLGTNDSKARFTSSAEAIASGIASLIDIVQSQEQQDRHGSLELLLICPPPVKEAGCLAGEFYGGAKVSARLASLYADMAKARGALFLDAGQLIEVSGIDGVHYEPESQIALGKSVAGLVKQSF